MSEHSQSARPAKIYDPRLCELGEGALWHPQRKQLFWFDILGKTLHSRLGDEVLSWSFGAYVSAAGWLDKDRLLIASETQLFSFDLETGTSSALVGLEADQPKTRSNDGRADPFGGFWIGTMGKQAQSGAGAIYRFYQGRLRRLYDGLTIPNAICFSPDRRWAHFADTAERKIWRVALDNAGWPCAKPSLFIDLSKEGLNPDGAVVDTRGGLWNAQWGAGRVARYDTDGRFDYAFDVAGKQASCPAFGGPTFSTLFVTTARESMVNPTPADGCVYRLETGVNGLAEPRVLLT